MKVACTGLVFGLLAAAPVAAQAITPMGKPLAVPKKVARAHPDLDGVWSANFILLMEATPKTPMLTVPPSVAKAVAGAAAASIAKAGDKGLDPELPTVINQTEGLPLVRGQYRTRLVVEPADGKLPYTPEARNEIEGPPLKESFSNPEDRPGAERCLVGLGQPPITSLTYLNRLQIVQTDDTVVLHLEYADDVRIIPLTTVHRAKIFRSRLGDSIGRWEGDTLVIETIGLPDDSRQRIFPALLVPGDSKVIERLTRVSKTELLYQFTIVDPKTYTAPWLGEFSWYKTNQPMFESACHEGNYSLRNILSGARHDELVAKAKVATSP